MENQEMMIDMLNEGSLAVKELEGRVYFEALPLMGGEFLSKDDFEVRTPPAVLGVRG